MTLDPFFRATCLQVIRSLALATSLASVPFAYAGQDKDAPAPVENTSATTDGFKLSGEFDVTQSYVGDADVRRSGRDISFDEYNSQARFVLTPRIPLGYLRLGVEWTRYSFGFSDSGSPLPNTLQAINAVVGLDTKFSDSILVRIEAQPGLYGTFFDHIDAKQFNVPFIIGGTYIYSPDLQFIGGLSVDIDRKYPVLPGAGLRWKFAPHWVFNGVLPTPRLEYEFSRSTTVYGGAEFKEDSFRVEPRVGTTTLDRRLNRALVTFSEVRVGGGFVQKITPSLSITAEGGCQPYREFDYDRADVRYRADGISPYGQIVLHGAF